MRITRRICRLMSRCTEPVFGKLEFVVGAGEESVGDQGGLGRPPTVDSCFANVGVGGDGFNAQFRESAILFEQFQGAAQNRLTRFLAARTPGRALPVGSIASVTFVPAPGAQRYDFEPWLKSNII